MAKNNSEVITSFLNMVAEAKTLHKIYSEEQQKQEALTQDYLHTFELQDLNRDARSKLARQLTINRRDRRYYKDRLEELEPIVTFFEDPANKKCLNCLTQLLGTVRKQESYHASRTYVPKVLPELFKEKGE